MPAPSGSYPSFLGGYRIEALLGAGGMGQVFLAGDPRLGRQVAIKILAPELQQDPDALARFDREAHAVAALNHPNILTIHDRGTYEGLAYVLPAFLACLLYPSDAAAQAARLRPG